MQPVVIPADQYQVVEVGGAAVFPVPDVMGMQTTGGPATGHRAGPVAVFQGTAQPTADLPGVARGSSLVAVRSRLAIALRASRG
ncbi:uncharacterized protein RMCT_1214 [Mycolicibacterium thermoresistibile]|jgi:hypothetical protein|uniref:Uncharacterized protein n=1 Tax=Mycolicibacterium thermoresistibile TaxID=1797 RepID=A0A117ILU6_MYCTH|nr:uncharacterized protein RMCT_1214 [Mycolicibacterium thermoresistibile]